MFITYDIIYFYILSLDDKEVKMREDVFNLSKSNVFQENCSSAFQSHIVG